MAKNEGVFARGAVCANWYSEAWRIYLGNKDANCACSRTAALRKTRLRLPGPGVIIGAIRDGVALLTWQTDTFACAESFDEAAGRYRGLRVGQVVAVGADSAGLLVKPDLDAEVPSALPTRVAAPTAIGDGPSTPSAESPRPAPQPEVRRFHGVVRRDASRVGRDASRIADEVISHLAGLLGAEVTVTLEIETSCHAGVPDNVLRTVTENSRTLKFTSHGFEQE